MSWICQRCCLSMYGCACVASRSARGTVGRGAMSIGRVISVRITPGLVFSCVVLTSLVALATWLASPARGDGAPRQVSLQPAFMQAVDRVAWAPAVHYATASRHVSLAVDV